MANIIIVEDEVLIADEIQMILELLGHKVLANIRNGDRALDAFANHAPDLVLLDITIQGHFNGIDLAKVIRKKYKFPFIFLTSHSDLATLNAVKETFPYGYIVKPFTKNDLLTNIELALHKFNSENTDLFPKKELLEKKLDLQLTAREYEIFESLFQGMTYKEIGAKHFISVNTVKSYLKILFKKLKVGSRHEAVNLIIRL